MPISSFLLWPKRQKLSTRVGYSTKKTHQLFNVFVTAGLVLKGKGGGVIYIGNDQLYDVKEDLCKRNFAAPLKYFQGGHLPIFFKAHLLSAQKMPSF